MAAAVKRERARYRHIRLAIFSAKPLRTRDHTDLHHPGQRHLSYVIEIILHQREIEKQNESSARSEFSRLSLS